MQPLAAAAYLIGILLFAKGVLPGTSSNTTSRLSSAIVGMAVIIAVWIPRFRAPGGARFQTLFLIMNPITLTIPVVALLFFAQRYLFQRVVNDALEVVFPTIIPRLEPVLGAVVLVLLLANKTFAAQNNFEPAAIAVSAVGVFALVLAPGEIVCSEAGVAQCWWWGRRKFLPWNQITAVQRNGDICIQGSAGPRIQFTRLHQDAPMFLRQLQAHANQTTGV